MAAIIVLLVAHACPASLHHTCTLCSGLGMGLNAFAVRRLSQPMKWHKSSTFTLSQSSDSFYLCKPLMLPRRWLTWRAQEPFIRNSKTRKRWLRLTQAERRPANPLPICGNACRWMKPYPLDSKVFMAATAGA